MARSVLAKPRAVSAPVVVALLALAGGAQADSNESLVGWTAPVPPDPNATSSNWVDTGHAYVTHQAEALTQWMDQFFGDPNYNLEQAESLLRLQLVDNWTSADGHDPKPRIRGKLQLPRISRRLDLVFSDEEEDSEIPGDDQLDEEVGLQYRVSDKGRNRFDFTLSANTGGLKPGVKYRNQGPWAEDLNYRFIQRVQHESDEGVYATSQFDINYRQGDNAIWRWTQRAIYGEETEGAEWRSRLAMRQRYRAATPRPVAVEYFGSVDGVTDPETEVRNYRLGFVLRRQLWRPYLFVEVEPSYNWRLQPDDIRRKGVLGVVLRLEFALQRDLARPPAPEPEGRADRDSPGS
jgi:hypothetical protein